MSLFHALTHFKWLKNPSDGFKSYVIHQENIARKRITPKWTSIKPRKDSFQTENDDVKCIAPSHVHKLARISFFLLSFLLFLLVIAEFIINFLTTVIVIMPGDDRIILASFVRIPIALTLTIVSILLAEFCFDIAFEKLNDEKKRKHGIPDSIRPLNLGTKSSIVNSNKLLFFLVALAALFGILYAIYYLADQRGQSLSEEKISGAIIEPLTLISLILPIAGGLIMVYIKNNLNLILAFKAMRRFKRIAETDAKTNSILVKQFGRKRMKILQTELSNRHKKINSFKNYLNGRNYKNPTKEIHYNTTNPQYAEDYDSFRDNFLKVLIMDYNNLIDEV